MPDLSSFPTWEERFGFASAAETINGIAAGWKRLSKCTEAGNKELLVTMLTSTGEILQVGHLKPESYSSFSADGYVADKPVTIVGHISTLQLTCSLENKQDGESSQKNKIGFNPHTTTIKSVASRQ